MIGRIEYNCTTGELKYFNENEVEIDPNSIPTSQVEIIEPIPVDAPTEG
jgi:hypothetical protein